MVWWWFRLLFSLIIAGLDNILHSSKRAFTCMQWRKKTVQNAKMDNIHFKKRFVLHYEEFKEPLGISKNKRSTEIPHLFCENAYWMRRNGAATKTGNSRPISWGAVGFNYRVVFCLRRAHWAWLGQISLGSKVNTIQYITCGRLLM